MIINSLIITIVYNNIMDKFTHFIFLNFNIISIATIQLMNVSWVT